MQKGRGPGRVRRVLQIIQLAPRIKFDTEQRDLEKWKSQLKTEGASCNQVAGRAKRRNSGGGSRDSTQDIQETVRNFNISKSFKTFGTSKSKLSKTAKIAETDEISKAPKDLRNLRNLSGIFKNSNIIETFEIFKSLRNPRDFQDYEDSCLDVRDSQEIGAADSVLLDPGNSRPLLPKRLDSFQLGALTSLADCQR
ncbi:hypothetical protein WN51_09531 [Melipona quadrifasciata]|uniref:Uncharacterized protein n=1 Tax=Melipona quadrifasciata TaxID=166423 RepID=A0A0N0BIX3_9HYME|nr:hypothetical protein WN51_09531 [Melipona quadrifasciata]